MNIEESNILIADFMGWKQVKSQRFGFAGLFGKKQPAYQKPVGFWNPYVGVGFFQYHTSWDWLMPVWKKLTDLVAGETEEGDYPMDFCAIMDVFALHCEYVDISAANDIVCKAIQWYNNQSTASQPEGKGKEGL